MKINDLKRVLVAIGGVVAAAYSKVKGLPEEVFGVGLLALGWAIPWFRDARIAAAVQALFAARKSEVSESSPINTLPIEQVPTLTPTERAALSRLRRVSNAPPILPGPPGQLGDKEFK